MLFDNADIGRKIIPFERFNSVDTHSRLIGRLDEEGRIAIGEYLASKGYGEWIDANRKTMRVTWRTPDDWGRIIYKHFADSGLLGTIYTFYELHSGDVSEGTGASFLLVHLHDSWSNACLLLTRLQRS